MNKIRFFDGGMGTMLQAAGLLGPGALPEPLNLTHPEEIAAIHQAYADAGAEFISTNTFGANGLKFGIVEELVQAATALVRRTGKKVVLDIGPLGKLLQPMGELAFDDAYDLFARTIRAGAPGADLVLIETMSDTLELKAAVLAAKENCDLPVFTTMIMDEKGRLLTGADIETAVTMLEGLGVDALGFNCSMGPDQMLPLVAQLRELTCLPIIVNPNAGLPESVNGETVYNVDPEAFAEKMEAIAKLGQLSGWLLRHHSGAYCKDDPAGEGYSCIGAHPGAPHAGEQLFPNGGAGQKAGHCRRADQPHRQKVDESRPAGKGY